MVRRGYAGVGCAALICQCGVCGVNMPVWGCAACVCQCGVCGVNMPVWGCAALICQCGGVRRVYAGVLYSCNTVRVCNPCCSVTLYCVVSSTFVNRCKYV